MEDVFKPRLESHRADVQQPHHIKEEEEDPQPPCLKEEEAECWTTREGECLLGQEEADLSKFPLNAVSVKTEEHEDKPPESSQLHHSPTVVRHLPSEPQGWGSRVEEEQPQPPRIKGEDEDRSISQDADRFEGLEEFPVIVVIVKSEAADMSKKAAVSLAPRLLSETLRVHRSHPTSRTGPPGWSRTSHSPRTSKKRRSHSPLIRERLRSQRGALNRRRSHSHPALKRKRRNTASVRRERILKDWM
ncbi:uncharacterized protein LOC133545528 isoform X5 [Nerophis ophidion]|uniref:uncharacterized protein LOC133545528 isoform X5 n=1 Tax=Nerophis ophidion TaxID=159077 RepID=UPI002ADFFE47|nr:uncharacterized protein LOC133545528 isoform X5 [Nerophis ophidion]